MATLEVPNKQIRIREIRGGYYGHNGVACLTAKTRAQVIQALKAEYPDEYEIIDIDSQQNGKNTPKA